VIDTAAVYAETQRSLSEFVRGLPPEELHTNVPATPLWSVRDAVAHLAAEGRLATEGEGPRGVLDILASLNDPEQARLRDEWNAEEVGRRRDLPFDDVVAEWDEQAARVLPMLKGEESFPVQYPFIDSILVTDLSAHGQDIRNAVGRPGERDSPACRIALAGFAVTLGFRLDLLGIPALRLRYDGKERVCGSTEPGATLAGDRYELFRTLSGRRSRRQIEALDWEGDPEPYLSHIPAYGERFDDVSE